MDVWMDKMATILEDNKVNTYLMVKYVDDMNMATSLIKSEYRWEREGNKWRLVWSEKI